MAIISLDGHEATELVVPTQNCELSGKLGDFPARSASGRNPRSDPSDEPRRPVSQPTVSRYMPTSRKDRRSQAWRTFIRNHAITVVQSHSFDSHNWAHDLLSQARYRSRIFTYHLSAFVIAPIMGPSFWVVWHTVHPLLVAVAHPRVQFTRIPTLTAKSTALTHRCPPASRKVDLLTIDRIRGPPAAQQLKRHGDHSSTRLSSKRVSFTRSTRRHSTASSTNCPYSQTAIGALECHPRPGS